MEAASGLVGGRYRIVERLGEGGMSIVWRGHDQVLGRYVAVKVLTARFATQAWLRERVRIEALAAARLSHPHVTSVYDYGESPDETGEPVPFIVMELLSGRTLAARLTADGPPPVRTGLRICAQVAGALTAAHAAGLVHRDVKPGNVMLTPAGAKVFDFGLAAVAGEPADPGLPGELLGTPAFLAPERITSGEAVPASDVYGLGLLLYATLTGGMPWPAGNATEMLAAHRDLDPAPLPPIAGLPPAVAELCRQCLAKDPADRPSTSELARVLAAAGGLRLPSFASRMAVGHTAAEGDRATQPRRTARLLAALAVRSATPAVGAESEPDGEPISAPPGPLPPVPPAAAPPVGPVRSQGPGVRALRGPAGARVGRWRAAAVAVACAAVVAALFGGLLGTDLEPGRYDAGAPGGGAPGVAPAPASSAPATGPYRLAPGPVQPPAMPGPDGSGQAGGAAGSGGPAPDAGAGADGGAGADAGETSSGEPSGTEPSGTEPSGSEPAGPEPSGRGPTGATPTGAEPSPTSGGGTGPGTDPDPGTDPASPAATSGPMEQAVQTEAGTLTIRCEQGTASYVSGLLPGYTVVGSDPGQVRIVRDADPDAPATVIACDSGAPVVATS